MNPTGSADQVASVSLPPGWSWARLADIARINPPLDIRITDDAREVTFVPMAAVDEGFGGVKRPQVRTFGQVKKGYTPFQVNDVIMAKITPCMENGKGGVVRGRDDEVFFGSTEFHVLRARAGVLPEWVGSFLAQERIRRAARLGMKGSAGQLRVPEEFLERLYFPLPPTAEQQRIADRIDELFTDLAAGVAALERVKRNLTRYRAAVLHAAVTGRLTEAWRKQHGKPEEPGPKLLERILAERRRQWEERTRAKYENAGRQPPKNWRGRYPEPSPPKLPQDGSSLPELPAGWCWASIDQLTQIIQYGTSAKTNEDSSGVPVLRMGNITTDGTVDFTNLKYLPHEHDEFPELLLERGDILFNRTNSAELVGKTAVFEPPTPGPYSLASYLIRVRMVEGCSPWWLTWCVISPLGRRWLRGVLSHTAGQANVNGTKLAEYTIPLPPLAEQSAIVEAVNEKLSQIDGLGAEIERGLARASRLRQSILKAAFEGKLVPQDPADEPASVLLERIKQQASEPTPKSNGTGDSANGSGQRRRGRPRGSRKATSETSGVAAVARPSVERRSRKAKAR
ncbi:MAG: restriction endonuclease subunit S [Phycisphaerae bacterium]|nr:restriction endonuclease subunit S [Phycisphaerae bacterium]